MRAGWSSASALLLGVVIVVLSSVAPFVRFGSGGMSVNADDAVSALWFALAWLPFLLAGALASLTQHTERLVGSRWLLAVGIALLPLVAPAHTALYFTITGIFSGRADTMTSGIPFLVLTMLGAFQYLTVVALIVTDRAGRTANQARIAAAELHASRARLEQQLSKSRLAVLQAQLQPHFLFNTLNSVSALVTTNPPAARRMLIDLSALLRVVLDNHERPLVSVSEEMEFARSYLAIQQVRFGDRLTVEIRIDEPSRDYAVPPMLLQPLVENAVHHAMTSDESSVDVMVRSCVDDGRLVLEVVNSGPAPVDGRTAGREGLGLRNTRQRLTQLFAGDYTLTLEPRTGAAGAVVRVDLPARTIATERSTSSELPTVNA